MTPDSLAVIAGNLKISYKEKMNALYRCNPERSLQQEKQLSVINRLLSESKKEKDVDGLLYIYVYMADLYNGWNDNKLFNVYMDSADVYAEEATRPLSLAHYHYTKGTQAINLPYGKKEGYKQFEKALDYYEQACGDTQAISYYIYNMTVYTANRPDTAFSKKLIRKIENILQKDYSPFTDFALSTMKSDYHKVCFDAAGQEELLDSAIFYEKKRIHIFCSNEKKLPGKLDYDILQSYLLLAEYHALKREPDWNYINGCIGKAESIGYTDDSYIMSRIKYTKALSLFEQKKYDEAEKEIADAEILLSQQIGEGGAMYPPETFYSDESVYASLHSRILFSTGNYKDALKYNRIKNDLRLKMRELETRELEYLYNTEKEEYKIEQLKMINANQIKSISMLILIALLLAVTIALLCLWFYTTKKSIKRRSALIKAEKEEAELNLKIKEEQAVKAQLEKYEVLSDYRLKEMELEGKNKAMEQLLKDKEILDGQIEAYMQKINEYERINDKKQVSVKAEEPQNKLILEDMKKMITRKMPDRKDYIDALYRLNEQYISVLRDAYNGNLSVPYMKYCICFVIGMEIGEVSDCFSIEQPSVHMVRYRLKKKFGLDNNDDLSVFLRKMNNALSSVKVFEKRLNPAKNHRYE
jgi:hypothetical protein